MHGPEGANYENACVFRTISAPPRIGILHESAPRFVLTVGLAQTDGGMLLTWAQAFDTREMADRVRSIVEPANEQNLDRLQALLRSSGHSSA